LTTYLVFRAAAKKNIPTIYYAIDIEHRLVPFIFLQPLGKIIERLNICKANLVISINEGLKEYTVQMGADSQKTSVIRAGIDSARFNPQLDGNKIREQYGLEKDDIVLFFMGWIYHFSGLKEVAIELARLRNEYPKLKLLVVGDGDAYQDIKKIHQDLNLGDKLILTGKQPYDRIPDFIAASDICLLPAYNNEIMKDIVPIKMYEYMAVGKPIIATKLPGVMMEFGMGNGVFYVDRSEDVLYKAIELIDANSIKNEGQNAWKFVQENDWDKITCACEIAFRALL